MRTETTDRIGPEKAMATDDRLFTVPVTSLTHIDHQVTDEECAARGPENRGDFRAVCGVSFLPGPMEGPPGKQCPSCNAIVRAVARRSALTRRPSETPSKGRISRMFKRLSCWGAAGAGG